MCRDKIYWLCQAWLFTLCGLAAYGIATAAGMMLFLAILQLVFGWVLVLMVKKGEITKQKWPYVNVSPKLNLFMDFLLTTLLFLGGFWFIGIMWLVSCLVAGAVYNPPDDDDKPSRGRRYVNQSGCVAGGDIIGGDRITV